MIPDKATRDEWRRLAVNTMMTSAVGEYTPDEFTELLDAVDTLTAPPSPEVIEAAARAGVEATARHGFWECLTDRTRDTNLRYAAAAIAAYRKSIGATE